MKTQIDKDTQKTMRDIADFVKEKTGGTFGFMVMVFPFGEGMRTASYISNCKREDMIKALREKANSLEKNLDIEYPHEKKIQ